MTKTELAREVVQIAHLQGDFLLRSGKRSHEYFDKYRFESQPKILKEIARHLSRLIPSDTEALAGLEMGGIPVATALALETGLPVCFVRKEPKSYGTCQFAEGLDIVNKKLCVIEDVITTGGQALISSRDLINAGAHISTILCVIYRGELSLKAFKAQHQLEVCPLFERHELIT